MRSRPFAKLSVVGWVSVLVLGAVTCLTLASLTGRKRQNETRIATQKSVPASMQSEGSLNEGEADPGVRPEYQGSGRTPPPANAGEPPPLEVAQQRLLRLQSGTARERLLSTQISYWVTDMQSMALHVGMSSEELESLAQLVVGGRIQQDEARLRCKAGLACTAMSVPDYEAATRARIEALLGTGKARAYESYLDSVSERGHVAHLQAQLSEANHLTDAQYESLIAELTKVRKAYLTEASNAGTKVSTFARGSGMLLGVLDASAAEFPRLPHERAVEYSRRLRERAISVLTPGQFSTFEAIQEDLLQQLADSYNADLKYSRPPGQ